jgi:regulator of PEP synthase PpsR (kinase-PPPase family)
MVLLTAMAERLQRIYGERFPNKQQHHHTSFTVIHRCLRELGKFEWSMTDAGRDRRVRICRSRLF